MKNPAGKPTQINNVMFDPPNGQVIVDLFFQTFRISCGELVEQVETLRNGIGAI
jgi:hypothetical protein